MAGLGGLAESNVLLQFYVYSKTKSVANCQKLLMNEELKFSYHLVMVTQNNCILIHIKMFSACTGNYVCTCVHKVWIMWQKCFT